VPPSNAAATFSRQTFGSVNGNKVSSSTAGMADYRRQSEHLSQPTRFVEPDIEANKAGPSASFNDRN
jgi:hypothetical protein